MLLRISEWILCKYKKNKNFTKLFKCHWFYSDDYNSDRRGLLKSLRPYLRSHFF